LLGIPEDRFAISHSQGASRARGGCMSASNKIEFSYLNGNLMGADNPSA
jgi:hypothetical protein